MKHKRKTETQNCLNRIILMRDDITVIFVNLFLDFNEYKIYIMNKSHERGLRVSLNIILFPSSNNNKPTFINFNFNFRLSSSFVFFQLATCILPLREIRLFTTASPSNYIES